MVWDEPNIYKPRAGLLYLASPIWTSIIAALFFFWVDLRIYIVALAEVPIGQPASRAQRKVYEEFSSFE